MDQKKIGAFIAEMRKEKGMTQEQFAEWLGTSQRSVSRWENGKTMPDLSLYEPLCEVLGVQVSELLYGKRMSDKEKIDSGETTALNLFATKTQLETFAVFTEILITVGILISITLTKMLATTIPEVLMTLGCGWFVWGYGLVLRVKLRKALRDLEKK